MMRGVFLFLLFSAAACLPALAGQRTVNFTTKDNCAIEAFYLAPSTGAYVFINAHGLGSSKEEWGGFQAALGERGQGYLSLDLRGHGASRTCGGKTADYKNFTREDWSQVSRDVEAAAAWLKKKGLPAKRMVFCGASVGANLALKAAAEGKLKPAAVVLLSPGLNYAGVTTGNYFSRKQPFRIFIAASQDDPYAWQSRNYLAATARENGLAVKIAAGKSGHGVNMFTPELMTEIIDWVSAFY
jgi:alpha-beta hydrolase superfamily lysophospholipase